MEQDKQLSKPEKGNSSHNGQEFDSVAMKKELFYNPKTGSKFKFMDGKTISFNKEILCWFSNSPVIYQMVFGPLGEDIIKIKDCDHDTFKLFLDCVVGFVQITNEFAFEIFPVACKYLATDIIEKCIYVLKPRELNENVCHLLNMATMYNQPKLLSVVKEFVLKVTNLRNKKRTFAYELIATEKLLLLLSPDALLEVIKVVKIDSVLFKSIISWCDNFLNYKNKPEDTKNLLDRFGILRYITVDLFEAENLLYEFTKTDLGKMFFTTEEICKYFMNSKRKRCSYCGENCRQDNYCSFCRSYS